MREFDSHWRDNLYIMKLNYLVLCYKDLDGENWEIKHKCIYETMPTEQSLTHLMMELATDPEFGMIGDDDYEIQVFDRSLSTYWFDVLEIPEELD